MRYLNPLELARLKSLSLGLSRLPTEAGVTGRHRSLQKGGSHDFSQHRSYAPGDELKSLDWKLYARHDRFFVKEYREETVLSVTILLDASGSMAFGAGQAKWERACRLALALAYLVVARGDSVGLVTFNDRATDFIPNAGSVGQLQLIDSALGRARPAGKTDLPKVLESSAGRIRRRSLVALVSDLMGDSARLLKSLTAFKARKHELMVLQVLDPAEKEWTYNGPAVFESMEDGSRLSLDASFVAEAYRREFDRLLKLYETAFRRSEVPYGVFYTHKPWEEGLARLIGRRT